MNGKDRDLKIEIWPRERLEEHLKAIGADKRVRPVNDSDVFVIAPQKGPGGKYFKNGGER